MECGIRSSTCWSYSFTDFGEEHEFSRILFPGCDTILFNADFGTIVFYDLHD